jgi:phosphoglycolate phosphatase
MINLIFDFDGVLADSGDLAFEIVREISRRQKLEQPTGDFLRLNSTEKVISYLKLGPWKVLYYLFWGRRQMWLRRKEIELHPWSVDLLNAARKLAERLYVLSTNSPGFIVSILETSKALQFTDAVIGNASLLTKQFKIKRLITRNRLNTNRTFLIGDETRDIEAAKRAGIKSIAVGWGYHSMKLLQAYRPDFAVETPEELINLLGSLAVE